MVALTLPVGLEAVVSWAFARPFLRDLPGEQQQPPRLRDIFWFSLPLTVGGYCLSLATVILAGIVARAAEPERMIPVYYLALGLASPVAFAASRLQTIVLAFPTPFGLPSDPLVLGTIEGRRVAFLPRHARGHRILPGELNFRANIYGFRMLGIERLLSAGAVGSLREEIAPRHLVIPDQIIDRTYRRAGTFFDELATLLVALHTRHIAYVDLNKRQNILVGDDGRPYLIDFQISLHLPPTGIFRWRPFRWLLARFQHADRYHVLKHKRRLRPDLLTPKAV